MKNVVFTPLQSEIVIITSSQVFTPSGKPL